MIKPSTLFMILFPVLLSGCPAHTDIKATLKDFGIGELDCGKAAVANEMPTITPAVGALLGGSSPNGQSLLDALFRQAPELIACSVKNLIATAEHPVIGQEVNRMMAEKSAVVVKNGKDALSRWGAQ
jgi:hypothetical protein